MIHVSIDLETLGTSAGCVVLSIGAVTFDYVTQSLGREFYAVINQASCEVMGLQADKDTVEWWGRQSEEARMVLTQTKNGGIPLSEALDNFAEFFRSFGSDVRIWSNGADFDLPILGHCYAVTGKRVPWQFWNTRCYRTLKNLLPNIEMERFGTHHDALSDAKSQAVHAMQILRTLAKAARLEPAP